MKRLIRFTTLLALVTLTTATSASAQDDPVTFDFLAYAQSIPAQVGGTLKVYGHLTNNGVAPTPIPMTWGPNIEHTIVIEGTLATRTGTTVVFETYSPCTVKIFTDNGPTTVADFANPGTFEDGDMILLGTTTLSRTVFPPGTSASYSSSITWTGGSRVGELGANTTDWAMGGGATTLASSLPNGYHECLDGKIDQPTIAVEQETWGAVKGMYQ